jgi:pimeloyl-ACP methyl ester carboxylesterase
MKHARAFLRFTTLSGIFAGVFAGVFSGVFADVPAFCQGIEVEKGEIEGAAFRIQIPAEWNRGLVMYAHGYRPRGGTWFPLDAANCSAFLERGFALAESSYSRQGWALEEAVRDTEALRKHFVEKHGKVKSTFVTGHSMGGAITLAVIETYPGSYDGAMPMCGPLVPATQFFRDPVLDMLVTFEALFGESLPEEQKPVIDAPSLPGTVIAKALESDPDLAARFAEHWGMRLEDVPSILITYHALLRELKDRAGGNPIDNRNSVYTGFGPIWDRKLSVPRCTADPEAVEYLRRHYTPTGKLDDPVLAVHTAYDPGVPPRLANSYHVTATLAGSEELFVHKYVEAEGHCNIAPDLVGKAFDELRKWAAEGVRPEAGLLR